MYLGKSEREYLRAVASKVRISEGFSKCIWENPNGSAFAITDGNGMNK